MITPVKTSLPRILRRKATSREWRQSKPIAKVVYYFGWRIFAQLMRSQLDDGSQLQVRPEIVHQESSSSVTSTASSQQSTEHGHHRHHHLVNEEKCRVVNCRTHPRHFIVLPFTNSKYYSRWQLVEIAGVDDEVQAHCGIFIRTQNLDYEAFVERVGKVIIGWQQDSHHT